MAEKEYIEREVLLNMRFSRGFNNDGELLVPFGEVAKAIRLAPTADVGEVRHGEWLKTEEPMGWHDVDCIECSACHGSWVMADDVSFEDYVEGWKYCPNCGAKMDGKGEGE